MERNSSRLCKSWRKEHGPKAKTRANEKVRRKRREIAEAVVSGRKTAAQIARIFGVSPPTVSREIAVSRGWRRENAATWPVGIGDEAFIEAYRYNWDPWRAAGRHVMAEADSALLDTQQAGVVTLPGKRLVCRV